MTNSLIVLAANNGTPRDLPADLVALWRYYAVSLDPQLGLVLAQTRVSRRRLHRTAARHPLDQPVHIAAVLASKREPAQPAALMAKAAAATAALVVAGVLLIVVILGGAITGPAATLTLDAATATASDPCVSAAGSGPGGTRAVPLGASQRRHHRLGGRRGRGRRRRGGHRRHGGLHRIGLDDGAVNGDHIGLFQQTPNGAPAPNVSTPPPPPACSSPVSRR